jgi:hypothetical protein
VFCALRKKDAIEAQTGAQGLFNEVWAFDSCQASAAAAWVAEWVREGAAKLFEAGILFTLYNAKRHGLEPLYVLADSMPFCRVGADLYSGPTCTNAGAVLVSVFTASQVLSVLRFTCDWKWFAGRYFRKRMLLGEVEFEAQQLESR